MPFSLLPENNAPCLCSPLAHRRCRNTHPVCSAPCSWRRERKGASRVLVLCACRHTQPSCASTCCTYVCMCAHMQAMNMCVLSVHVYICVSSACGESMCTCAVCKCAVSVYVCAMFIHVLSGVHMYAISLHKYVSCAYAVSTCVCLPLLNMCAHM